MTGGKGTDAGNRTATASLTDKRNRVWSDGTTEDKKIEWSIAEPGAETYTVRFVDWDGTELQSGEVARGQMPAYAGKTPKRASTAKRTYTFKGWSPKVRKVTGKATYRAVYTSKARKYATLVPKMTAKGKRGLTLTWNKVKGADGYDVFFSRCDHDGKKTVVKKAATLKGNGSLSWAKTGLKANTAYKARVRAYVMQKGKKVYVKSSAVLHLYTSGSAKGYTNAKAVKTNAKNVSLAKGGVFGLEARIVKQDAKKKLMPKSHAAAVRYLSTDRSVATVAKDGTIRAVGRGTCCVYAYAHNGASKKVTVTVR